MIEVVVNGCVCRVKVKELAGDPFGTLDGPVVKPKAEESTNRCGEDNGSYLNLEELLRDDEVALEPINEENVGCFKASGEGAEKENTQQTNGQNSLNDSNNAAQYQQCVANNIEGIDQVSESRKDKGVYNNIDGSAQLEENVGSHSKSILQLSGGALNLRCDTADKGVRVSVNDSDEPAILIVPETPTSVLKGGVVECELREQHREGELSDSGVSEWETDDESEDVPLAVMKSRIKEARLKKNIGRRKAMDLILESCGEGVRWSNIGNSKEKLPLKRNNNGNVTLSMKEACSLLEAGTSISEEGSRNRNDATIEEVHETWKVGKALGLTYDGDEGEIISRLMELEKRDWVEYERCHLGG